MPHPYLLKKGNIVTKELKAKIIDLYKGIAEITFNLNDAHIKVGEEEKYVPVGTCLSGFEIIKFINEAIADMAIRTDRVFANEEEFDEWMGKFDEARECYEVFHGIWHVVATNHDGQPKDQDWWDAYDQYVRVEDH